MTDRLRVGNGLRDRIYLVDHPRLAKIAVGPAKSRRQEDVILYKVCGTRDVHYEITIFKNSDAIECTCPDYKYRRSRCKHIYCLIYRMLRFPTDEGEISHYAIWNKSEQDIVERFSFDALPAQQLQLSFEGKEDQGLDQYDVKAAAAPAIVTKIVPQREYIGTECIICMEEMSGKDRVVYCKKQCGRSVHDACFSKWKKVGKHKTCVYCRADY
jgi:hypothetical protein